MNTLPHKLRILRFLDCHRSSGGGPLTAVSIWEELTLPGQPQMTKTEFDAAFRELETINLIASITPQLDAGPHGGGLKLWAISDRGVMVLAQS